MGAMRLLGNLLIAYGPSAVVLLQFVAPRSILFIITITSGFFWLLAALLAAIIWVAIPPLKEVHEFHIVAAILCQALFRYMFVKAYMKVELRLPALLPKGSVAQLSDASSAIASGLGFGLTHSLVMYGAIISQGGGVESVRVSSCDDLSVFNISAGNALLVNVLHMGMMIWAFDAYRKVGWKSYLRWGLVVVSHLAFSFLSLGYGTNSCALMMILQSVLSFVMLVLSWKLVVARHVLASQEAADRTGIGAHFAPSNSVS
eukprot:gb/GECG01010972.1/.p1 GENE.gb/GECG01010972.1/~~gb/GECG01010972.1/.p1  ORF type:complete len:259 (+),score=17.56 gb/GECG01010972.1/:1-777(+)